MNEWVVLIPGLSREKANTLSVEIAKKLDWASLVKEVHGQITGDTEYVVRVEKI